MDCEETNPTHYQPGRTCHHTKHLIIRSLVSIYLQIIPIYSPIILWSNSFRLQINLIPKSNYERSNCYVLCSANCNAWLLLFIIIIIIIIIIRWCLEYAATTCSAYKPPKHQRTILSVMNVLPLIRPKTLVITIAAPIFCHLITYQNKI